MHHFEENWDNNYSKYSVFCGPDKKYWLRKAVRNAALLASTKNLVEIQSRALPQVYKSEVEF